MSRPPQSPEPRRRSGDPWHVLSYLVAGVGMYGLLGWGLDRWLDTSFLLPTGIVLGAVLGVYLTWARFQETDQD